MAGKRKEWFEAKTTLECVICDKDIEVGDHYCLNDTGDPMHYYCYEVSTLARPEKTEKQTDSEGSEGNNNGEKELRRKRIQG
jgi:hypothetical protein